MRPRRALGGALVLAACAACDLAVTAPASGEREALRFQVVEVEDTSVVRVLGLVDQARLQISGGGLTLDTIVSAAVHERSVIVRLLLSPPPETTVLTVQAELRAGVLALMAGSGTLRRGGGDRILLRPLPERFDIGSLPLEIDALGDTIPLSASVLFATGDVWRGARPTWQSDDPGVLEVRPGDIAISRSNGFARLRLSFEDVTSQRQIRVAQRPIELWGVAPADTTIAVGDSFPLRVFGEDRNGFALLPGTRLEWLVGGGVFVDSVGVVTATEVGPAFARAILGTTEHTAAITVLSAPSGS